MGKRNKEPQVGRRRPMIQLGGSSQKSGIGVVSRNVVREEEKENNEKNVVGPHDAIDDQLAGFLAEINSLDDTPASSEASKDDSSQPVSQQVSSSAAECTPDGFKPLYDISTFDPVTQSNLLPDNWQAIQDETTFYYYYWNTLTNEVQWYPPASPLVPITPPPPPPPAENGSQDDQSMSKNSESVMQGQDVNEQKDVADMEDSHIDICDDKKEQQSTLELFSDLDTPYNEDAKDKNEECDMDSPEMSNGPAQMELDSGNDIDTETDDNHKDKNDIDIGNKLDTNSGKVDEMRDDYDNIYRDCQQDAHNGVNSPKGSDASKSDDMFIEEFQTSDYSLDIYSPTHLENVIEKRLENPSDKSTNSDAEQTSSKDKDKELMSKIKEKIQRKKEEKLRKVKQEMEDKAKEEEELVDHQKAKEEMLREKLIRKKCEREKALVSPSINNKASESDEKKSTSVVLNKAVEKFTVDIFACEDLEKNEKGDVAQTSEEQEQEQEICEVKKESADKNEPVRPQDVVGENSAKEKGGWRIIDAMYDDDDDDDDEVVSEINDEIKIIKEERKPKDGKVGGEMDDYAEMLLEGAIGEKEEAKPRRKRRKLKESFVPALPLEAPPPPPPEPEMPPLPPEDEPSPQVPEAPAEEEDDLRSNIDSMSNTLKEKLHVLGMPRGDVGKLQLCFTEVETRLKDYQAGALDGKYFLDRLKEVDVEILKHEENSAPSGWISHWSSHYKMYYYYNAATGASQWDHPVIPHAQPMIPLQPTVSMQPAIPLQPPYTEYQFQPEIALPQNEMLPVMNENEVNDIEALSTYTEPPPPPPETTAQVTVPPNAASIVSPAHGFSREPIPSEHKKRAVPSDGEKLSADPYRDPYRTLKKKRENPASQNIKETANCDDGLQMSGTDSGTESTVDTTVISAAPMMREVASDIIQDAAAISYGEMTPPPPPPSPPQTIVDTTGSPRSGTPPPTIAPTGKSKVKKKKKLEAVPSKKLKHVSSLVQKWQSVKQQVEEEENVEEESDEDYETASERRIIEWKREMERSEYRKDNPNFTEIKGDWRARLKRKTTT